MHRPNPDSFTTVGPSESSPVVAAQSLSTLAVLHRRRLVHSLTQTIDRPPDSRYGLSKSNGVEFRHWMGTLQNVSRGTATERLWMDLPLSGTHPYILNLA